MDEVQWSYRFQNFWTSNLSSFTYGSLAPFSTTNLFTHSENIYELYDEKIDDFRLFKKYREILKKKLRRTILILNS